jgi:Ca-activated chloride channel family protein
VFTAPRQPGTYEIRYIKANDASVEGSTSIEVFDLQVSLTPPARVSAGTRFEVAWQGPDGAGDFISVAPPGSQWKRKLDWAFTATGSPANLAAPFARGIYEVRYISGSDSRILEAVTITVE